MERELRPAGCTSSKQSIVKREDTSRGEWYVLIQILLILAVGFAPELQPDRTIPALSLVRDGRFFGGILCVAGLGFSILALAGLGRNLSIFPRPKRDSELVEAGLYAIVRHPIYFGIITAALGWSIYRWSILSLVFSIALFLWLDAKARREEAWLAEKFPDYPNYQQRVKKLIPFIY